MKAVKLYEKLATKLEEQIRSGIFLPGDRIPSVRQTSQQHQLSIKTVLHAYLLLESKGVVQSRPKSGYFVHPECVTGQTPAHELRAAKPIAVSAQVDVSRLVLSTLRSIHNDAIPLGSPYPDPSLFPVQKIDAYGATIGRRNAPWGAADELPPGNPELIRQIAKRYAENGQAVDPNEIIVTIGATEAINLCLQAVAKPGDTIAVESPTFYAMLHAIERMGLRAIEVPTHAKKGIDLVALARIFKQERVAACMVMPNFQNPLGFRMSETNMQRLVDLSARHAVPLIESAVYNELYFGDLRPTSLKALDKHGLVLHCSSFSKSLTTGHHIGWAIPGRFRDQVEKLKFLNTLTTPSIAQKAIAEYLNHERYEHHLRRLRKTYEQNANLMRTTIERYFPEGTRTSHPMGGYVLWVELPPQVDSLTLYERALERQITLGPGYMFSTSNAYGNCIRLNYSYAWSTAIENALITLGELTAHLQHAQEPRRRIP